MFDDLADFHTWFAERRAANHYEVSAVPVDRIEGWRTEAETGDLVHHTGKFFAVRGLEVGTDHRETAAWTQPIIHQPEIGILGIVVKVVRGEVRCLLQAKMEPGNINLVQLSPTVQATRSNYTRVHKGNAVPYLEHFVAPREGRVALDVLQSEQGSWFLSKRNRNMIVEVPEDPVPREDFCWLSTSQIAELLRVPNLVNMDARTVLSGLPFFHAPELTEGLPAEQDGRPLHTTGRLLSWFTGCRARYQLNRRFVPLAGLPGWRRIGGEIIDEGKRFFSVTGVRVEASSREVGSWSQPMLRPVERGVIGFLGRHIDGVFHVLVHARTEAGTQDVVEMAPTVTCIPASYAGLPAARRPRYLRDLEEAAARGALVDVVHSEEGGRFYHAENRYVVADVGPDFGLDVPEDYCWMTPRQLTGFLRYGNHVNVAARCLLSCFPSAPALAAR
ncbi:NDP-hexose 2,3-dehydratase [Amycolatopsis sp. TNS106]|nr:NDP-hexose 2,3-dehydratase family protein [Amycolatopsis sp. TNS106]QXV61248.1 NDP-hexose 2,3-dehydratase [Amycolatopsis sp. TNS106]